MEENCLKSGKTYSDSVTDPFSNFNISMGPQSNRTFGGPGNDHVSITKDQGRTLITPPGSSNANPMSFKGAEGRGFIYALDGKSSDITDNKDSFLSEKDSFRACSQKTEGSSNFDSLGQDLEHGGPSDSKDSISDDAGVKISSSVKVVTTKSVAGTFQMFLVPDPDNDDGDNLHSIKDSEETQTDGKGSADVSGCAESDSLAAFKRKDLELENKTDQTKSINNENGDQKTDESNANIYDKPSRRSLRLKTGKRSTPSFSYRIHSDDESVTDIENEMVAFTPSTKTSKTTKTAKLKSAVQKYPCDQCSAICKTAANLKRHKLTHSAKPFTCSQCSYSCKRKSDMKKHAETHGPKNLFKCMECDYSGKRLKYLKKHMQTHSKDSNFSCHLCEYRCNNKAALDNHLCGHSNLKPHNCVECGMGFSQKSSLNKHMVTHSDNAPFSCTICDASFKRKDHLKKHEIRHKQGAKTLKRDDDLAESKARCLEEEKKDNPGVQEEKEIKLVDEFPAENSDDAGMSKNKKSNKKFKLRGKYGFMKMKGGPIQCTLCEYSCATSNLLQRHMRRHSDSKPFICPLCGASFKRKDHLMVHKFTHSDLRPHKCPHCSYGTHRKYRLKLHILTHQTIKPIKCSICTYSCRRDCELHYHMRNKHGIEPEPEPKPDTKTESVEAGELELKCELCDYICDSQKRLKYHMARHENKTPHSCPHCDYKCSSRSSLTDHLLQHAGIKPCLCSVCGMSFRNTSRLNRHKLVHSDVKPYGCDFCDFSSRSKYNLKQHMLRHTDQEKARRRNRRPPKPKASSISRATEAVKQTHQTDFHSILGQVGPNIYLENITAQPDVPQVAPSSHEGPKFIGPSQPTQTNQCYGRNQLEDINDHLKPRSRPLEQHTHGGFSTGFQSQNLNTNPYQMDRPQVGSAVMNSIAYNDPYQHANPFIGHSNHMPYNPNMNHANPNFWNMERNNGGYGFTNPYFYNETVFPGNMNTNMNFYMGSGNGNSYSLNSGPVLPMNQNIAHLGPQISPVVPRPVVPPPPLQPMAENKSRSISETEDSHMDNLEQVEDVSVDLPADHRTELKKNPSHMRSQAKKTGATLDGGKSSVKNEQSDAAQKSTHVCSECGYICLTNTMLQRHKTTHVDLKPYKCEDCGKTFKRRDHMKAHKRTHNEDKPFSCQYCSYVCSRKYRLKLHEMTHIDERPFNCSTCENTFDNDADLQEHMKIHADGFMFSCNKCDFKCKEKTELRFHSETHKTFLCEKCSYVCRSSREFNSHKRMHAEKEELVCKICSYTCDSQKRLKYHMERHENKTPHACPQCDYKCSSRSSLTDHLLQHEGLKPYLCSVCGMKFRNVSRLNRHKLTHTDIKPHACDFCPFSSRSRYNLKQHMLRHFK